MNVNSKSYSVSLSRALSAALEEEAQAQGLSPGAKIADIVELHFLSEKNTALPADEKAELKRLRWLRNKAIEKMEAICGRDGFSSDITLKTFEACKADPEWRREYESYVRGNALLPGNPRKTNANQTIGGRIKSKLRARDLTDASGKAQRGRAPLGSIIQTYQLLELD